MTCTAKEFTKVARTQLGVKESPANSNNVKYNTAFYGHHVYGSSYAWCFVFLWWCAGRAEIKFPHNANAAYGQDELVSKCGAKWIMKKNTSRAIRKAYLSKAKRGDVVDFDFGAFDAFRRHVGVVYSVQGEYIWCIEGNTSKSGSQSNGGMVCLKKRHYTDICSAVRPPYAIEKKVTKKKSTTKKKTTAKKKTTTTTKKTTTTAKKKKIYVNAGHSNTDPGAVSKYGKERTFNVKVRNAMVNYLEKNYVCEVKWNDGNLKDLKEITGAANKWGADLYVSIHFNAANGKADGWEGLLYSLDDKHKKCGRVFEKHVKAIGQNSRGLRARPDLKNLSLTNMMAILNECAYIDNWKDIKDWNENKELKKMGEALAKAAAEYLNLKKK